MTTSKKHTTLFTTHHQEAVKAAFSAPRIATYEASIRAKPKLEQALALYNWNAQVSAALLAPLHICEVTIRNAVSDALVNTYGDRWPWHAGFIRSLPNSGYWKMQDHIKALTAKKDKNNRPIFATTGQIIPEIKFVFWEKMFTERFDNDIWNKLIAIVMPNIDSNLSIQQARKQIYDQLNSIRLLRNRIAHHEPIFNRNLESDFKTIHDLINIRCSATSKWMNDNQRVSSLFSTKNDLINPETAGRKKIKSIAMYYKK